jgi:precorrin-3B C17-methyltransferase
VALVSSGDPNVYGMAGLGLEMAARPASVEIVPGVTSFTAASCRAGLAFRECVAAVSLSDLLTHWPQIEGRLRLAAETRMPVALYNPKSRRRDWQLLRAEFGTRMSWWQKHRREERVFTPAQKS